MRWVGLSAELLGIFVYCLIPLGCFAVLVEKPLQKKCLLWAFAALFFCGCATIVTERYRFVTSCRAAAENQEEAFLSLLKKSLADEASEKTASAIAENNVDALDLPGFKHLRENQFSAFFTFAFYERILRCEEFKKYAAWTLYCSYRLEEGYYPHDAVDEVYARIFRKLSNSMPNLLVEYQVNFDSCGHRIRRFEDIGLEHKKVPFFTEHRLQWGDKLRIGVPRCGEPSKTVEALLCGERQSFRCRYYTRGIVLRPKGRGESFCVTYDCGLNYKRDGVSESLGYVCDAERVLRETIPRYYRGSGYTECVYEDYPPFLLKKEIMRTDLLGVQDLFAELVGLLDSSSKPSEIGELLFRLEMQALLLKEAYILTTVFPS